MIRNDYDMYLVLSSSLLSYAHDWEQSWLQRLEGMNFKVHREIKHTLWREYNFVETGKATVKIRKMAKCEPYNKEKI